jgi:hypothetical protein
VGAFLTRLSNIPFLLSLPYQVRSRYEGHAFGVLSSIVTTVQGRYLRLLLSHAQTKGGQLVEKLFSLDMKLNWRALAGRKSGSNKVHVGDIVGIAGNVLNKGILSRHQSAHASPPVRSRLASLILPSTCVLMLLCFFDLFSGVSGVGDIAEGGLGFLGDGMDQVGLGIAGDGLRGVGMVTNVLASGVGDSVGLFTGGVAGLLNFGQKAVAKTTKEVGRGLYSAGNVLGGGRGEARIGLTLQGQNGHFVTAQESDGKIVCKAAEADAWEYFCITRHADGKVGRDFLQKCAV